MIPSPEFFQQYLDSPALRGFFVKGSSWRRGQAHASPFMRGSLDFPSMHLLLFGTMQVVET